MLLLERVAYKRYSQMQSRRSWERLCPKGQFQRTFIKPWNFLIFFLFVFFHLSFVSADEIEGGRCVEFIGNATGIYNGDLFRISREETAANLKVVTRPPEMRETVGNVKNKTFANEGRSPPTHYKPKRRKCAQKKNPRPSCTKGSITNQTQTLEPHRAT